LESLKNLATFSTLQFPKLASAVQALRHSDWVAIWGELELHVVKKRYMMAASATIASISKIIISIVSAAPFIIITL